MELPRRPREGHMETPSCGWTAHGIRLVSHHAHQSASFGCLGRIALMRCAQGWTGPLGPRSRRIDCMIANVVVQVKISMSAPPSTRVYFAMTGAAACRG